MTTIEAVKAFGMYQRPAKAERGIIIGHGQNPIEQAHGGWQAFRMNDEGWTDSINMSWIDGAIDAGKPVLVATPVDKIKVGSVTWRELMRVKSRGGKIVFQR